MHALDFLSHRIRVSKGSLEIRKWQIAQNSYKAVFAQGNEIFIMFCSSSAISWHGCHEKSALTLDGELRTVASSWINFFRTFRKSIPRSRQRVTNLCNLPVKNSQRTFWHPNPYRKLLCIFQWDKSLWQAAHGCKRYFIAPQYASGAAKMCFIAEKRKPRGCAKHIFVLLPDRVQNIDTEIRAKPKNPKNVPHKK